jgi:phosphoglycolate phosphatase
MRSPFLVVLDCDGTLVDAQAGIIAAMQAAFTGEGLAPPAPNAIRRTVGLSLRAAIARLSPDTTAPDFARLEDAYKARHVTLRQDPGHVEPLYEGAIAALDRLEGMGALLAIATGKGRRGLEASLDRHGISDRFVALVTADDAPGKPAPDMLHLAMDAAGIEPARTLMVGDTSFDMEMARAARVRALGVAWGYHAPADLRAAGAERVLESFADLPGAAAMFLEGAA